MIDYNVSDHWTEDDPPWLKSLVSSLYRPRDISTVLPLPVVVEEISEWVELASDSAWTRENRVSLSEDLGKAADALGPGLRSLVTNSLSLFQTAFQTLKSSSPATRKLTPGMRQEHPVWRGVGRAAHELLTVLDSDEAVRATWTDLVAIAQDRGADQREHRPIAELLYKQLQRRGLRPESVFHELASIMAFGGKQFSDCSKDVPVDERLATASVRVGTPVLEEPIVVWLGYRGPLHLDLSAGRVTFLNAHVAIRDADLARRDFRYKAELREFVHTAPLFRVATHEDDPLGVDLLARVDLGTTTPTEAVTRAEDIVNTILSVSILYSGGKRPLLVQCGVLQSGTLGLLTSKAARRENYLSQEQFLFGETSDAIQRHGPWIAEALARDELPRFLGAAIESQAAAMHPFSRERSTRTPAEVDVRSLIPLADRVVEHVAAHCRMKPKDFSEALAKRWAHSRWRADLHHAARMCLLGGGPQHEKSDRLAGDFMSPGPNRHWILLLADRVDEFLSLCRVEHERAWITKMLASVSDHNIYYDLIREYVAEGEVLYRRRARVRNALVHGNPASSESVQSVRDYSEFLSGHALNVGLESYVEDCDPAAAVERRSDEFRAMEAGQSASSYWRARSL